MMNNEWCFSGNSAPSEVLEAASEKVTRDSCGKFKLIIWEDSLTDSDETYPVVAASGETYPIVVWLKVVASGLTVNLFKVTWKTDKHYPAVITNRWTEQQWTAETAFEFWDKLWAMLNPAIKVFAQDMTTLETDNRAATPEPPPKPGGVEIAPLVIQDILARVEMGRAKYGTVLQAGNGRNPAIDAYQEALDLPQYLKQLVLYVDELHQALRLAADALDIAADHITDVQIGPPKEWALDSYTEDAGDGWCSVSELATKLRELTGEGSDLS